jgi:hypothetical protein
VADFTKLAPVDEFSNHPHRQCPAVGEADSVPTIGIAAGFAHSACRCCFHSERFSQNTCFLMRGTRRTICSLMHTQTVGMSELPCGLEGWLGRMRLTA